MPILLIYKELNLLVDAYYKCPEQLIKEQILMDLQLLTDALLLLTVETNSDVTLTFKYENSNSEK